MNLASNSQQLAAPITCARQQYVKFLIQPELMAVVEIEHVIELIDIPLDRVVPMPHLPPAVRGVYNWRGEILWIIDLAMLLGVKSNQQSQSRRIQPTILIGSDDDGFSSSSTQIMGAARYSPTVTLERRAAKTIGLLVDEIVDIEWFQIDLIRSVLPDRFQSELATGVVGVWTSTVGENFLVLDGRAILERTDLHADV